MQRDHALPFRGGGQPAGARPAAVLLPVTLGLQPEVIAILRSARLSDHGGEVGFPGGKPEPGDADLWATAIREAGEELGIRRTDITPVGRLRPIPVITGKYLIHPHVVAWDGQAGLHPDGVEVERVLRLPVADYFNGSAPIGGVPSAGGFFPHFPLGDDVVLYGASAVMFYELLSRLAAVAGVSLPAPTLSDRPPWADRYR